MCVCAYVCSVMSDFVILWTVACQLSQLSTAEEYEIKLPISCLCSVTWVYPLLSFF